MLPRRGHACQTERDLLLKFFILIVASDAYKATWTIYAVKSLEKFQTTKQ